jgi:chromosome segregation protein
LLRRLSVHGFKSFCDRTEIVLGSGITAIVGPNGCGKSNLADALRWVLGEQNPRMLRSGRLQDLIFSGTESRKAMGMAEVKLLFDSVEDGTETEIMRRFARDGSGEYRLNGKVCRWRDVVETLAGTGLSHTGYVVIGQGTIHELASGRPEDRRAWIEEASGVARVRLDKRDMEIKLEAASADIARLDDLLVELTARKGRLDADKEAARAHQELSARRRDLGLSMWLYQFDEEERKLVTLARRLERHRSDLREAEMSLPRLRDEEASLQAKREPLVERLTALVSARESAARDLLALEKKRDAVRGQITVLKREIEVRAARKAAIRRDLESLAREQEGLQPRREQAASRYEAAAAALRSAEENRQSHEALRKGLGEKVIAVRTEVVTLTGEIASAQRAREDFWRRLEDVRKEKAALQDHLKQAQLDRDRQAREIRSLDEKHKLALARAEEARESLLSLESRSSEVKTLLERELSSEKNLGARIAALKARRKLLEDMERSYEGYGKGPRTVLEARAKGTLAGIRGSVGELFSCDPRYILALSAAVGGAAEDIVVADENAAKSAIAYLKEMKGGRATFLPLSVLRPREMHSRGEASLAKVKGVRPLLSVLSYPAELDAAAKYLVGRVVLAETMDVGLAFMRESTWTTRVVTLTGESIEPGGAISGGEAPRSESLFRRKHELALARESDASLSKELETVLARRKALERESASLTEETAKARSLTVGAGAEVTRLAETRLRLESQLKTLDDQVSEHETQAPGLAERDGRLSAEMERAAAREKEIAAEVSSRGEVLRRLETEIRQNLDKDRESEGQIRVLIESKEGLERDLSAVLRRLEGLSGERTTHEHSLAEEEKETSRQSSLWQDVEAEEKALCEKITVLEAQVSSLARDVEDAQADRDALTLRLSEVAAEIDKLERDRASLSERADEAAAELDTVKAALDDTIDLIEQEFGIKDPRDADHPTVSRAAGLPEAEALDNQMKALGSVNLKAEEDWNELADRINLITQEKTDVEAAILEINRARGLVEKEIEARFLQTFGLVAGSFREIFQELFGGGRGDLSLIEETLGVEVIAEPPGRRQKQLNLLSGGERSLCGIALIFAILSVKPSPFIVLDEADTALDDSNIVRFGQFLKRYAEDTQFLVVTHQKVTMEAADLLYGVTMEEPGVSKIFGMKLEKAP